MLVTSPFGTLPDGSDVTAHTLARRPEGLRLTVLDLGATVARLRMPSPAAVSPTSCSGCARPPTTRRRPTPTWAPPSAATPTGSPERASPSTGRATSWPPTRATTCLHGGPGGLPRPAVVRRSPPTTTSLELELVSPDGDQGFPGTVTARVRYVVSADTVTIEHRAETDAPTVVSLTNHAYFNLAGSGTVDDHRLTVAADAYLPVDAALDPPRAAGTGAGQPVRPPGRRPSIGDRVRSPHPQVRQASRHRPRLRPAW